MIVAVSEGAGNHGSGERKLNVLPPAKLPSAYPMNLRSGEGEAAAHEQNDEHQEKKHEKTPKKSRPEPKPSRSHHDKTSTGRAHRLYKDDLAGHRSLAFHHDETRRGEARRTRNEARVGRCGRLLQRQHEGYPQRHDPRKHHGTTPKRSRQVAVTVMIEDHGLFPPF